MADLPSHPQQVDPPGRVALPLGSLGYRNGVLTAVASYAIPSLLTAPVLVVFSADPVDAMVEGAFLWTCAMVFVVLVHSAVAIGMTIAATRRRRYNDPAGAEGLIHGWIYGLTGNVLLFQISAFVWSVLLMTR